ncbi:TPA: DNA-binding transcriptional activator PunR [Klebsiella pneumoniae]
MWSEYSLEVVDAVARNGSFSAAAQELHRVPSAVSYTVRQLEEWLAVPLFERRHRDVELTPAGVWFLQEGRSVIKKMQITRQQCQQIANGWRGQLSIAVDDIVKPARMRQMIVDFYRHFPDVELIVFQEVFNGVWDALADGRVELAIGATRSIPVGGRYAFRDMGMLSWDCVVASDHPLAKMDGPLSDDVLRNWPSLVREDTSRSLPKRTTWLLDNQKRVVVPDWESSATCLSAGLCVGMVPSHFARPWIDRGEWTALALENPFPDAACCLTWQQNDASPALNWMLDYLGDSDTLNREWLRAPERCAPARCLNDDNRQTGHPLPSGAQPDEGALR